MLSKVVKYGMALGKRKTEQVLDPEVQIEQAITEAQSQHQRLLNQAARVLGNKRDLEKKYGVQFAEVEKLTSGTRQAIALADEFRGKDDTKAASYEQSANLYATQLVAARSSLAELETLVGQATASAQAAKDAVEQNALVLLQSASMRNALITQLDHAKMQEEVNKTLELPTSAVPSFADLRNKVEERYALAAGKAELNGVGIQARMQEVNKLATDAAALALVAELRNEGQKAIES